DVGDLRVAGREDRRDLVRARRRRRDAEGAQHDLPVRARRALPLSPWRLRPGRAAAGATGGDRPGRPAVSSPWARRPDPPRGGRAALVAGPLPPRFAAPMHYATPALDTLDPPDASLDAFGAPIVRVEANEIDPEPLLGSIEKPAVALLTPPL